MAPGAERAFLAPMPLERLWGIGPRTLQTLHGLGLQTIGDLAASSPESLVPHLGRQGPQVFAALCASVSTPIRRRPSWVA